MKNVLIISFFLLSNILLAQSIDYETEIQPIFDNSCVVCHSGANPSAGLNLSSYENVMAGNVIDIGNYENSTLWQEVSSGDMPNNIANNNLGIADLTEEQVDLIANWILDLECMSIDCLPEYTCILGECVCINDSDGDGICDEFENETSLDPTHKDQAEIVKIFDLYGQYNLENTKNQVLIYIYSDGTVRKEITIK
jgi:hypothetical protein